MANGTGQLYQIANLLHAPGQEAVKAEIESKEAGRKVDTEKAEQKNMLMELMEEELKKAQKKKSGGIFGNIGKLVSFWNPIAGATLQGLGSGVQAKSQKSALEKLSKSAKFKQYGGTWLSDPSKGYMKDVGKMSKEIKPWETALATGVTSYGTGQVQQKFGEAFKDPHLLSAPGELPFGPLEKGVGESGPLKNLFASIKEGGGFGGGGLEALFTDAGVEGKLGKAKGISEKLLSLLDLLNQGGGQEVDENYERYFGGLK